MSGNIKLAAPSGGSVTLASADTAANFTMSVPAAAGVLINADSATGAAQLPVGTTAQRPASPVTGQLRFNSTTTAVEVYNGSVWVGVNNAYAINYLTVAGGAGGSGGQGAGGGAGGLLTGFIALNPGITYTVTVGAGGAAATNGSNSVFSTFSTAIGGGKQNTTGGSGGGGTNGAGGSGTSGQGNAGGSGIDAPYYIAGGGGGAGAVGGNAVAPTTCGSGGAGLSSSITGSAVTYAGGGGAGAGGGATAGAGGSGGGGAGGPNTGNGTAGTANTGGGGGGGGGAGGVSGAGGSGVVILSVPTANYSGTTTGSPTVTTSGSNTILKFTASGSYTA